MRIGDDDGLGMGVGVRLFRFFANIIRLLVEAVRGMVSTSIIIIVIKS